MGVESRQLTITKDVAALLGVSGKPVGLNIHRNRERPIWIDDLDAVVVYPAPAPNGIEETVDHDRMAGAAAARVRRTFNFRTEIRVEFNPDSINPTDALDPVYVWVVGQLAPHGSVAGVLRGPHEQRSASVVETDGERWVAVKVVEWEVEYRTKRADPTEA